VSIPLFLDFVFRHFIVEQAAIDLEMIGSFGFISRGVVEGLYDQPFFEFGDGFVKGKSEQINFQLAVTRGSIVSPAGREVFGHDDASASHQNGTLNHVFQFADISGVEVILQGLDDALTGYPTLSVPLCSQGSSSIFANRRH
jgi:hypothetical protein